MKVFACNRLPNGLEFGGVVVAESINDARLEMKKMAEQQGWQVTAEEIELIELDLSKPNAKAIDPMNQF